MVSRDTSSVFIVPVRFVDESRARDFEFIAHCDTLSFDVVGFCERVTSDKIKNCAGFMHFAKGPSMFLKVTKNRVHSIVKYRTSHHNIMATAHAYLAQLGRSCLTSSLRARPQLPVSFLLPTVQQRYASKDTSTQKYKKKGESTKKKKKARTTYKQYDIKDAETFYLLDAMRYAEDLRRSL